MSRSDAHPHGKFTDLQRSDPVNAANANNLKHCARLFQDPPAFTFSQRRERLILQRGDRATLIVVTHPTRKRDARTGVRINQLSLQSGRLDWEG
jgi:hypothetical protein